MLLTTKELLSKFNISYSKLSKLISSNNIRGFWFGRNKKFDENEIELNLRDYNNSVEPFSLQYSTKKIAIIEFYQKYGSIRKVSVILGIHRSVVTRTIREYQNTGSIEVDSKLKNLKNGKEERGERGIGPNP